MADKGDRMPDLRSDMTGTLEPSARWVRVMSGGETIAESKSATLLLQYGPGILPTYFFNEDEVEMARLVDPKEINGRRFWTVQTGDRAIRQAAWAFVDPPPHLAALSKRLTFDWRKLDWYEESERAYVHARDPHKRVDVMASTRHVRIEVGGQTIADTRRPHLLFETWLPTRFYIPPEDVRMDYLRETRFSTQCPYKGTARYWSVTVGDQVLENVCWSYPDPIPECPKIAGLLCFFNEKVDLYVDGERMERPLTPWS
jgi:uncharacterized protein (DUF427 family)